MIASLSSGRETSNGNHGDSDRESLGRQSIPHLKVRLDQVPIVLLHGAGPGSPI